MRIMAVPPGQAPKWVREEWVGLELPIAENTPPPKDLIQAGVNFFRPKDVVKTAMKMTGEKKRDEKIIQKRVSLAKYKASIGGYPVETVAAIEILGKKSSKAARWWEENLYLKAMPWLVFKKEVCELI